MERKEPPHNKFCGEPSAHLAARYIAMSEYIFFKYRPVNKFLLDSLVKAVIYFPNRKQLNDPFDCNVDIVKSVENAIEQSDGQTPCYTDTKSRLEQSKIVDYEYEEIRSQYERKNAQFQHSGK